MRALKKSLGILILAFAFTFTSTGCSAIQRGINYIKGAASTQKPTGAADEKEPIKENAITIGVVELDTYNPLTVKSPTMKNMLGFMFEPLFVLDDKMNAKGILATGSTVSPDGKTLHVTLKQNVMWHSGELLSAKDVVYTINTIMNNDTSYSHLLNGAASASVLDNNTVQITFKSPTPNTSALLVFPIIKNGSFTDNFKPIGTGPFYIDYDKLSAFPYYHGEKPSLERINIRSVPDNEKFLSLFNASVIDIADSQMINMNEYMPRSNAKVHNYLSNEMVFVGFNTNTPVFKFKEARTSISAIIDRQEIASHIYFSYAEPVNYPVNPDFVYYPKTKGNLACDKGTAEKILKDADWEKDKRGVYFYSDKISLTYFSVNILVNSDDKERLKIASLISDAMTEMGMRNSIVSCTGAEFSERILSGNYDMFIGRTSILPNNDLSRLIATGNSFNYSDRDTDILLAQIATLTNDEDKQAVYTQLYDRVKDECPIAPICFLKDSLITSAKLKSGVMPTLSGGVINTENWSVK